MSTLTLTPEPYTVDEDEPYGFIEFDLPAELNETPNADRERTRYDEQILAALVSP